MITLNFNISDFNISGRAIPEEVADKILKWHILPMQRVRDILKVAIWASQKSGYRSKTWEDNHGRNGSSQHVFKERGAVDWTCHKFEENEDALLTHIINETSYSRICVYKSFIHCDYKLTESGRRELYESGSDSKWKFKIFI